MQIYFDDYEAEKFQDGRMAFKVRFKDKGDKKYTWTPKWDDLSFIFLLAYTVERLNRGRYFKPFVDIAQEIFTHYRGYIENPKPGFDRWGWKT